MRLHRARLLEVRYSCLYVEFIHGQASKVNISLSGLILNNHCSRVVNSVTHRFGDLCLSSINRTFCFCNEWQARANFLQVPKTKPGECTTFLPAFPRDPISSQPPSLPEFNFSTVLPTSVSPTVYLPNVRIGSTVIHWVLRRILS
jgi:hypothetical protein